MENIRRRKHIVDEYLKYQKVPFCCDGIVSTRRNRSNNRKCFLLNFSFLHLEYLRDEC